MINQIKKILLSIPQASLAVNANLAQGIILGYIQSNVLKFLRKEANYKNKKQAPIFSHATTKTVFVYSFKLVVLSWY